MMNIALIAGVGAVVAGFTVVALLLAKLRATRVTHEKAQKIADAISQGAMTFLREEYRIIAIVVAIVAVLLGFAFGNWLTSVMFIIGAAFSMITGYLGMRAATIANVQTTVNASEKGEHAAFMSAFFGGGVMGFAVAAFGLCGVGAIFYNFLTDDNFVQLLTCFSLGASLVAFFARVGGGIFTKSADVGADLVGKIEIGIPEDDPRNPAVIADNVGDCVGDTAGMGADIYESYVGALVSSIILATNTYGFDMMYASLPLVLASFGLGASVLALISSLFMRLQPGAMLHMSTYVAIGAFLISTYFYIMHVGISLQLFAPIILGCFAGLLIGKVTEYYTGGKPVYNVADSSETGAATNIIYGFSVGMESTVIPVVLLALVILAAFNITGGLFGVSLVAVAMLSTVGITMTVDAYGPIADNAGGIAEMAGFDPSVRKITDKLDALGNTTAAMGKGFAIGSALLTSLAMFSAYAQEAGLLTLDLLDPVVMVGMFIGGVMPFLISALTMRSVGDAALEMVKEVRRQFKTIPGLMEGTGQPDYARCIEISTKASLREMVLPGLITITVPVIVWYTLGVSALGGFLAGATVVGVLLALMMANAGGVWDNAKKLIETGYAGGKGSDAHKAAVTGDTVGDPFKDTSGPALNILIKLMAVISLLLVLIK